MRLLQSVLPMVRKTNKPQRIFVVHLVRVLLRLPGPATFRHFSRYSAYHAEPFARQFAKPFDFVALNKAAILTVVPAEHEPALALDASFMAKRGQQTYGLERCWNSGHGRAERGLEIPMRGWVEITPTSAYGLSVGQPPPSHPAEPESTRIAAYLEQFSRVVPPVSAPTVAIWADRRGL